MVLQIYNVPAPKRYTHNRTLITIVPTTIEKTKDIISTNPPPQEPAKNTNAKPQEPTKNTNSKPQEPTKNTDSKPQTSAKNDKSKPLEPTKNTDSKPPESTKTINSNPQEPTKNTYSKPQQPTKDTNSKPPEVVTIDSDNEADNNFDSDCELIVLDSTETEDIKNETTKTVSNTDNANNTVPPKAPNSDVSNTDNANNTVPPKAPNSDDKNLKRVAAFGELFGLTIPLKRKRKRKRKRKKKSDYATTETTESDVVVVESKNEPATKNANDAIATKSDIKPFLSLSKNEPATKNANDAIATKSDIKPLLSIKPQFPSLFDPNIIININQTLNVQTIYQKQPNVNLKTNLKKQIQTKNQPNIKPKTDLTTQIQANTNSSENETVKNVDHLRTYGYPKTWTEEMLKYYTEPCERSRNFDCAKIIRKLSPDPSNWMISEADRKILPRKRKHCYKCMRCGKAGHAERDCPNEEKCVCQVCGQFNHKHYQCPNTLCLTCGKPAKKNVTNCNNCRTSFQNKTTCGLCGQLYHSNETCPSNWRQYLIPQDTEEPVKQNPRKFCYNCAGDGHFGFDCPLTAASEYPPDNPFKSSLFDLESVSSSDDNNNCDSDDDQCNQQNGGDDNRVIFLSKKVAEYLSSYDGSEFLKNCAQHFDVRIEFYRGARDYVRMVGIQVEQIDFRDEFSKWKMRTR